MDYFAVFGNPVVHSKSPIIFNYFFRQKNIAAHYFRILTFSAKNIPAIIKHLNLKGANITSPFKIDLIKYLDNISSTTKTINAVNTIQLLLNKLSGYNTDVDGVGKIIKNFFGKKALVLGAGGAANAAIFALKQQNIQVTVLNRTIKKAEYLSKKYNCNFDNLENIKKYAKTFDIIVNTISDNAKIIDIKFFIPNQIFIDANYNNSAYSEFIKNKNIKYINGEVWLINQAISAFRIFTEKTINIDNFKIPDVKYSKILLLGAIGKKISKKINNSSFINETNKNISKTTNYVIGFIDLNNFIKPDLQKIDLLIDVTNKSTNQILKILFAEFKQN